MARTGRIDAPGTVLMTAPSFALPARIRATRRPAPRRPPAARGARPSLPLPAAHGGGRDRGDVDAGGRTGPLRGRRPRGDRAASGACPRGHGPGPARPRYPSRSLAGRLVALVPAIVLLILAGVLRRLGAGRAAGPRRVAGGALRGRGRTMAWAVRTRRRGVCRVVVPAILQVGGLGGISLDDGSMAPTDPAGSLLLVVALADSAAVPVGEVVVIDRPDGRPSRIAWSGSSVTGRAPWPGTGRAATRWPTSTPRRWPPTSVVGVAVGGAPVIGALRAWMASPAGDRDRAGARVGVRGPGGPPRRRSPTGRRRAGRGSGAGRVPDCARCPPPQAVARSTSRPTS